MTPTVITQDVVRVLLYTQSSVYTKSKHNVWTNYQPLKEKEKKKKFETTTRVVRRLFITWTSQTFIQLLDCKSLDR